MEEKTEYKRRFGDRRDGRWVRDVPGLQAVMCHLMPNRTDCEAYLNEKLDITVLLKYIEKKNLEHPEYKLTLFHCLIFAVAKMVNERPKMNRFIQGRRMYERYDISMSFVCRRRFAEKSEEALMVLVPKADDTLDDICRKIVGDVAETRKSEVATAGSVDDLLDKFAAIPRIILIPIVRIVRLLDFWGVAPEGLTKGDPNFTSVFLSNLGSVKCPSVYHHLNNYGTNSFFLTVGIMHKEKVLNDDLSEEIKDIVDIGAIIDERIADGFYFARSLKLVKYLFMHPEMMEQPLSTPSNFDYR